MRAAGKAALRSIPARFWLTVTPSEIESDLKTRAGAYANLNAGSFFKSQQGALIYGWMKGSLPTHMSFNSRSKITQGLRNSDAARSYSRLVSEALASGAPMPPPGGYAAGSPGPDNPNFVRDGIAFADWENASNVDRSLAVIGTFDLTAQVAHQANNTAVITFTATNSTTLGSGLGWTSEGRDLLNSLPGDRGPFSEVSQSFTWTEPYPGG